MVTIPKSKILISQTESLGLIILDDVVAQILAILELVAVVFCGLFEPAGRRIARQQFWHECFVHGHWLNWRFLWWFYCLIWDYRLRWLLHPFQPFWRFGVAGLLELREAAATSHLLLLAPSDFFGLLWGHGFLGILHLLGLNVLPAWLDSDV